MINKSPLLLLLFFISSPSMAYVFPICNGTLASVSVTGGFYTRCTVAWSFITDNQLVSKSTFDTYFAYLENETIENTSSISLLQSDVESLEATIASLDASALQAEIDAIHAFLGVESMTYTVCKTLSGTTCTEWETVQSLVAPTLTLEELQLLIGACLGLLVLAFIFKTARKSIEGKR